MTIKILSIYDWMQMFNNKKISKSFFLNNYKVKTVNKLIPLKNYIKKINLDKVDIDIIYFHFVTNKLTYLTNFYNTSLKLYECDYNKLNGTLSNNKNPRCKNIIRNIYYKDILLYTQTGIANVRPFLEVLLDLFNNEIIDYKLLTPSALAMFKKKLFASLLSGFYFRSSILNPNVINNLHKTLKGSKIFTPTLGWSSYMLGFLSTNKVSEYVGTDVIQEVCDNTRSLAKIQYPETYTDIFCVQSEKLLKNTRFKKKYGSDHFDTIFFSPPYYKLELYRGSKQSTNLYDSYEVWLKKYWEETIKLCRKVIKKKGTLCYIISNYGDKINMNNDMNKITNKYFKLKKTLSLGNSNVNFTKHRETGEKIFIFKPI